MGPAWYRWVADFGYDGAQACLASSDGPVKNRARLGVDGRGASTVHGSGGEGAFTRRRFEKRAS